ncbi:MAG TPA: bifunctional hydroxymethylpyrimidine kinase/phosphomethylpyrimidine kinase [Candidatus Baltobacteraceae bacterium]|jgi:hydroxymethylpyrimidine/phosphomethylpyrimidine kinase
MGALTLASIGTTHPWNIAGIGLDARVAQRLETRHVMVIAGISAQGEGERRAEALDPAIIAAQIRATRAAKPDAYRVGALLSPESVQAVASELEDVSVPIVCDPVIASSEGLVFADDATLHALRKRLFPLCTLVTPNLAEASRLCGFPVNDRATMAGAAHTLVERDRAHAALVTGGHLEGDSSDVLYAGGTTSTFAGTQLPGGMRGTGCVLAAAIAIYLARGENTIDAITAARALVRDAIANSAQWNGERVWPW